MRNDSAAQWHATFFLLNRLESRKIVSGWLKAKLTTIAKNAFSTSEFRKVLASKLNDLAGGRGDGLLGTSS